MKTLKEQIEASNGDETFTLPVPSTYVINQAGRILYHFVDADHTRRAEPAEIVKRLRQDTACRA